MYAAGIVLCTFSIFRGALSRRAPAGGLEFPKAWRGSAALGFRVRRLLLCRFVTVDAWMDVVMDFVAAFVVCGLYNP